MRKMIKYIYIYEKNDQIHDQYDSLFYIVQLYKYCPKEEKLPLFTLKTSFFFFDKHLKNKLLAIINIKKKVFLQG